MPKIHCAICGVLLGEGGKNDQFVCSDHTPSEVAERLFPLSLDDIRRIRNQKLAESDWTQLPDAPLTAEQKAEWAAYRQALRDVPQTMESKGSTAPEWPVSPFTLVRAEE